MFRMDSTFLTSEDVRFKMEDKIMKITKQTLLKSFTAFAFAGSVLGSGIAAAQESQTSPAAESDEAEILTRGPVHEAFAGTVSFNPEPGLIVDKKPPALIEELPPEQELEGDNVTWIPGYWGWDEDQNDFLWISGIWRNLPPGRQWVPGYWADVEGRNQWTSGYWEDQTTTEVTYLPEPPKSLESGPNIKSPSDDHNWIPGNWVWRNERYAWRTGYWAPIRDNWSWTPAYYRWTHRGYIYVDGFWDYPVIQRGVIFAPIHFRNGYAFRPGYRYSPATVISLSVFVNHLFLRPRYGHYYFGDYYEPRYHDRGFFASYSYNAGRRGCDPIFAHYRWENRNDVNWERGRREYYEFRRDHVDSRPPRTWLALNSRPQSDRERGDFGVADRFDRVIGNHGQGQQRFKAVDRQDHARLVTQTQEIRKFGQDRQQLETRSKMPAPANGKKHPVITSEKINRSPVLARNSDRAEKEGGPPARLQARASEKDQPRDNADKPKRKNADGSPSNDQGKATPEHRVKPGEKRDPELTPDHKSKPDKKNKGDSNTDTEAAGHGNPTPGKKPANDPSSTHRVKPEENRNTPSTRGENADKPKRKNSDGPSSNDRVQPGQRRDSEPTPDHKPKFEKKRPASDPITEPRVKTEETRTAPSANRKGSNERSPQGDVRRTEKRPDVKVQPQERPRPSNPGVPQQAHLKKNPDQQAPSGPGVPDGEKKKHPKKDVTE